VKLATFAAPGQSHPLAGDVIDDRVVAFADGLTVVDVLARPERASHSEESWPLAEVKLLPPVPEPGTIYAIGLNYAKHIDETGNKPPETPIVFVKVRGSVSPPGGPIRRPEVVRRLDYEGELTIVMGAEGAIAGYCVADDVTARDLQGREPQWTRAKGADTFCPFGPWVTTADEVPDPGALRLRTWVNDELRQDSSTADLIFGCSELVDFIAQTCTLQPGDLILTGTPSGVGSGLDPPRFLESEDVVRIEIEGLGTIEHAVE
jgi:acylpyruvate hydrolase